MREMNAEDVMYVLEEALRSYLETDPDGCCCRQGSSPCKSCQAEYAVGLYDAYRRESKKDGQGRELPAFDLDGDDADDYVEVEPDPE